MAGKQISGREKKRKDETGGEEEGMYGKCRVRWGSNLVLIKAVDVWLLFRSHGGNAHLLIQLLCSSGMLALL